MKEDVNIEELFKQKFENFEGQVDPSAWANISQSIGTTGGATGATGAGLSGFAKVAIIVGAAAVTTFSVWYFTNDSTEQPDNENTVLVNHTEDVELNDTEVSDENAEVSSNEISETNSSEDNTTNTNNSEEQLENVVEESNETPGNEDPVKLDLQDPSELVDVNPNDDQQTQKDNTGEESVVDPNKEEVGTIKDPVEIPEIEAAPVIVSVSGNNVTFKANARNHDNVTWNFGDGLSRSGDDVTHVYGKPDVYEVTVEVSNGHGQLNVYTLEVVIEGTSSITKIPNILTPNNDNTNDYFFIESEGLDQFMIKVFDRAGNEVYSSSDPNFRWNGQQKDGSVLKGNYRYILSAIGEDGLTYQTTGSLTIQ